jgi:hypothetical protein
VRAAALASLLCLLVPLAACGDDDDAGKVVEGSSYEVTVPAGWDDESAVGDEVEVAGFTPELVLAGEREDGFATNVNVIRQESPAVSLDKQTRLERELILGGAEEIDPQLQAGQNLSEVERTTLDGREARAHEFELAQDERTVRVRQVFARSGDFTYVVSYTALMDQFDEELDAFESILRSWTWR